MYIWYQKLCVSFTKNEISSSKLIYYPWVIASYLGHVLKIIPGIGV